MMKSTWFIAAVIGSVAFGNTLTAQSHHHSANAETTPVAAATARGELVEPTEKDAAWVAEQRAKYPLKTCVISGEPLGSMGEAPAYIYRVKGQPDRLVMFCCDGCGEDFMADPEAALGKLKESTSNPKTGETSPGHH